MNSHLHPVMAAALAPFAAHVTPRFAAVSCSQCGADFAPGNHGYSHCSDHRPEGCVGSMANRLDALMHSCRNGHVLVYADLVAVQGTS
jgi:hypothetical protein